jgi:serine/threonine protein kinase
LLSLAENTPCKQQDVLPSVAVKQLSPEREKSDDELATEVAINSLHHPHLMKALAAYKRRGKQCLIFPWATGGNLRETWVHLDNHKTKNANLVPWAVRQLLGLSAALETLHNMHWRHGDLKPENILRFTNGEGLGTLVIADMGLAKFHSELTGRRDHTSNRFGTLRYEHPEGTASSRRPVSRRSDIWSFGCIVVEFVVWLLYGVDELERFDGAFASFFIADYSHSHKGPRNVVVNPVVIRWIKHMMTRDPRCQEGSVLRDVLELVETRLLVVENSPRERGKAQGQEHEKLWAGGDLPRLVVRQATEPSKSESDLPRVVIRQATEPSKSDSIEAPKYFVRDPTKQDAEENAPSKGRADSKELHSRLQEISKKIDLVGKQRDEELCWDIGANFTGPRDEDARIF